VATVVLSIASGIKLISKQAECFQQLPPKTKLGILAALANTVIKVAYAFHKKYLQKNQK
jgi:hypothetical protein